MIENIYSYKTKAVSYPRHDSVKNKEWFLDWAKYIYWQYQNNNNGIMPYHKIQLLRSYARGKQDVQQYKSLLLNNQQDSIQTSISTIDNNNIEEKVINEGYMSVDFNKIFNPTPKFIKNLIGKLESTEQEIVVSAIDKFSAFEKENLRASMLFEQKFGAELAPIDEMNNINPPKPNYVPTSDEELELFIMAGGLKLRYELEIEKVINHAIYTKSNIKDIKRRCLIDAIILNVACLMDDVDTTTQQCYLKYCDPADVIIQYCKDGQFQKAEYAAIQEYYTISDLRIETGLDEEEIKNIARICNNKYGNPLLVDNDWDINNSGYYKYDDFKVPVLNFYVKSVDHKYILRTIRKNGTYKDIIVEGIKDTKKDQVYTDSINVKIIYQGKWIMGTDIVFDTGKMSNIPFNNKTKDVTLPIHVVQIIGESMVECAIPLLDQLQIDFLKLQNLKAVAPPPGWSIELGALEEVSFDNNKWTPLELIRLATQTGILIYKASVNQSSAPGMPGYMSGKPIEWNAGGMGNAIYECIYSLEKTLQLLAENMGIDRVSAVIRQPSDQAVGVTKMGIDSTSDTLQSIYDGWVDLKERAANNIACRVPSIIYFNKDNKDVGYYDIIGQNGYTTLMQVLGRHPIQFGVMIFNKPTEKERDEIKQAAAIALQAGKNGSPGISMSDYMLIMTMMNRPQGLNFVRFFLAAKEKQKEISEERRGKENIILQSEVSSRQQQEKIKLETEAEAKKTVMSIAAIKAKGEEERKTFAFEYALKNKQKDFSAQAQADSEKTSELIQNIMSMAGVQQQPIQQTLPNELQEQQSTQQAEMPTTENKKNENEENV